MIPILLLYRLILSFLRFSKLLRENEISVGFVGKILLLPRYILRLVSDYSLFKELKIFFVPVDPNLLLKR